MGEASLDIEAPSQLPLPVLGHLDGSPPRGPPHPIELEEAFRQRDAELPGQVEDRITPGA
jgi:hypothetical protein